MSSARQCPEIVINYHPNLDLRIAFASAQGYGDVANPEYRFAIDCRLRHHTGSFTYCVSDLCFDLRSFAIFSEQLGEMQRGGRRDATLKNVGDMMVMRLEGDSRKLHSTLKIREYLAPTTAELSATLEVDYDLFVNKLRRELDRFVAEITQIEP